MSYEAGYHNGYQQALIDIHDKLYNGVKKRVVLEWIYRTGRHPYLVAKGLSNRHLSQQPKNDYIASIDPDAEMWDAGTERWVHVDDQLTGPATKFRLTVNGLLITLEKAALWLWRMTDMQPGRGTWEKASWIMLEAGASFQRRDTDGVFVYAWVDDDKNITYTVERPGKATLDSDRPADWKEMQQWINPDATPPVYIREALYHAD